MNINGERLNPQRFPDDIVFIVDGLDDDISMLRSINEELKKIELKVNLPENKPRARQENIY